MGFSQNGRLPAEWAIFRFLPAPDFETSRSQLKIGFK
jgi:hypothetical protein